MSRRRRERDAVLPRLKLSGNVFENGREIVLGTPENCPGRYIGLQTRSLKTPESKPK